MNASGAAPRVVVCFRWRGPRARQLDATRGEAVALRSRAEALGGRTVAWLVGTVAFDFAPDAMDDAIELVVGEAGGPPESCGVGIAGGHDDAVEVTTTVALGWGNALSRALSLSRIARAREVLLDPGLDALRSGRLLTRGVRSRLLGRERVRGHKLDLTRPIRPESPALPSELLAPPWIGGDVASPPPGTVTCVVAAPGHGGTRALREVAPPNAAPVVDLHPGVGEPLGALRRALSDQRSNPHAALAAEHQAGLEGLRDGEGLDPDSSAALLCAWLGKHGLVRVFDAERVDVDSLEVVARALELAPLAVVVHVSGEAALPEPLAGLTQAARHTLAPLDAGEATELCRAALAGRVSAATASRWARRGGLTPLGITQALAEAFESGSLLEEESELLERVPPPSRRAPDPHRGTLTRRLAARTPAARTMLSTMAVLATASRSTLDSVMAVVRPGTVVDDAVLELTQSGWLDVSHGVVLQWRQATARDVVLRTTSESERARLHRIVSAVFAAATEPLSAVKAGVHSILGGDVDRALPLLRRGAASARAAGLSGTADALDRFTETGDPGLLRARGLFGGAPEERAGLQRSDVPPRGGDDATAVGRIHASRTPNLAEAEGAGARFVQALRDGDHVAALELATEFRASGAEHHVAARLEGMAALARGETAQALRLLRDARELSRNLSPADRSRAALALAVALARAERDVEALFEALESLARAREAGDRGGERACAHFLAQLSKSVGAEGAATGWQALLTSLPR